LTVLAEYLSENPSYKIIIEGHVCCGPALRMSRKRAKSVYKYLIKIGAPKEQMSYVGKSFDEPLIPKERNEAEKDINRRVEIELVK
jgi:outer membrane protein OmpA-like peptidoglycan-associated protein